MKDYYDFSKGVKNPFAEHLAKKGYKVQVTDGDGIDAPVIKEYLVTPEEIAERNKRRKEYISEHFKSNEL